MNLTLFLPYLADPITGDALEFNADHNAAIASADDSRYYPVLEDGILDLRPIQQSNIAERYDQLFTAHGSPLDEFAFRQLPRKTPKGWETEYWEQRALSTAAIWDVLENDRRARGVRPHSPGESTAVVLTDGMPYMAYGLDKSGYRTFAFSPNPGDYGLGVYQGGRFARILIDWSALPLGKGKFDIVIFKGGLEDVGDLSETLTAAVNSLSERGILIIADENDLSMASEIVTECGLAAEKAPISDTDKGFLKNLLTRRSVTAPPMLIARR